MEHIKKFEKATKSFRETEYTVPAIQREVNVEVINKIYENERAFYKKHNHYMIPGAISIAVLNGVEYIIDGQHRMAAYKLLWDENPGQSLVININYYHCESMNALEEIYKLTNTSTPNDIARLTVSVAKLIREIVDHFVIKFSEYVKSTAKPVTPNISKDMLKAKLEAVITDNSFQPGEFIVLATELNAYYGQCSESIFRKWHVPTGTLEMISKRLSQLYLGLYRNFEWVDAIMRMKTRNVKPASFEHYIGTYRQKIPKIVRNAVWDCKFTESVCYCCGKLTDKDTFQCGHVIPVSQGGETKKSNLRPICASCNNDMGTMNLEEYKLSILAQLQ